MQTEPLPVLSQHDYPSFYQLMPKQLPEEFKHWEYLHWSEKVRHEGMLHIVKEQPVFSAEYIVYCRETGSDYNLTSLRNFAIVKAKRQEGR
ncbi:hypothetical protein GCM10007874_29070 [Labrys miyagiensis]|uniref:Uncharacterized protein n=1 Tax=Labrys miyagiensis TaxID=346912 RepID=A0ABQ6CJ25_9HYPH|nr:hypothetical protein [Labrys miyagiensis]GLS19890.1 hypothetical protein GCM10007874_29070 [Labrys miyagiensis]